MTATPGYVGDSSQVSVKSFGAIGNGVADDTTAIQAAINYLTGSAAPATNTRTPSAVLHFPAGTYKITADLIIRSVSGFHMTGDGNELTEILLSGTGFTQAGIFIDGSCDGIFEGFYMRGDGTEQVTDGIRLDWTTAALRSTTTNSFRDIRIYALNAVTYFSLECNGTRQLDSTELRNIILLGTQVAGSWSNSGNSQYGFAVGDGSAANNYDHVFYRCDASLFYYGTYCNASSIAVFGSQPGSNYCDFYVKPAAQCSLKNIQSQQSGTFLISGSTILPNPVSVEDVLFTTLLPNTGYPVITASGGILAVRGLYAWVNASSTYQTAVINLNGYSGNHVTASLSNICLYGAKTATIIPQSGSANVTVSNYVNYNPGTGIWTAQTANDVSSTYSGTAWASSAAQDPLSMGVASTIIPGTYEPIAGAVVGANYAHYMKLLSGSYAISNLVVNVVASSGNISVAAYTNSGTGLSSAPTGGRLATSGAVATPSIGLATISIGSTVTPALGDWFGISADNTSATFTRAYTAGATNNYLLMPGSSLYQGTAHPLPSTPAGAASAAAGNFAIRGS